MEETVRAHLIISGRVQGVFYRMETKSAADRFGVSGWVRNRRDGRVEALVEGEKQQVDALIQWCRKGPPPPGSRMLKFHGSHTGASLLRLKSPIDLFFVKFFFVLFVLFVVVKNQCVQPQEHEEHEEGQLCSSPYLKTDCLVFTG